MSPRRFLLPLSRWPVCFLLALALRPGFSAAAVGGAEPVTTWLDAASPAHETLIKTGEAAATAVAARLQTALLAEIARGGPVGAIALCREQALRLTEEAGSGAGRAVTAAKRTSLRIRNPQNRPDSAEREALKAVATRVGEGQSAPTHLLQRLEFEGGKVELRYYRTVGVAPLCVTCHGPREGLEPALARALAEAYPADEAVGYRPGDWRGLLRISLREPAEEAARAGSAARSQ